MLFDVLWRCRSIGLIATTSENKRVLATTCDDGQVDFDDHANELLTVVGALEKAVFADNGGSSDDRVRCDKSASAFLRSAVGATSWRRDNCFALTIDGRREEFFALARTIVLPSALKSQATSLLLIVLRRPSLSPWPSVTDTTAVPARSSPLVRSAERSSGVTTVSATNATSGTNNNHHHHHQQQHHRHRDMQVVIDAVNEMDDQTVMVVDARGAVVGASADANAMLAEHCDGSRRMDDVVAGGQDIWLSLSLDLRSGDERVANHPLADGMPSVFRIHRLEGVVVVVFEALGDSAVSELLAAREKPKQQHQHQQQADLSDSSEQQLDEQGKPRRVRVRLRKSSNIEAKGRSLWQDRDRFLRPCYVTSPEGDLDEAKRYVLSDRRCSDATMRF